MNKKEKGYCLQSELVEFTKTHISCSIRNKHDAQDIMQDCYVCYFEMSKRYKDLSKEEFLTVAKVACRNKVRDYIRSEVTRKKYEVVEVERTTQTDVEQINARVIIENVMKKLDHRTQCAVFLMVKGLTPVDIKKMFSMSNSRFYNMMGTVRNAVKV